MKKIILALCGILMLSAGTAWGQPFPPNEAGRLHPAGHQVKRPLLALAQAGSVGAGGATDLEQAIEPVADPLRSVHLDWHAARVADHDRS